MDKLKQWIALTVVGALAILAAGWFLLVSPKRGEAEELRTQAADQVAANGLLATQIEVLKAKAQDLPKEQARLARVSAKIPETPALPGLVRSLLDASNAAGVELVTITPGPPVVATPPAPVGAEGTTGEPVAAPVAGSFGQLASIPVAISVVGDYFEVAQFAAELEKLPRALRVHNLTMSPGSAPSDSAVDPSTLASGRSLATVFDGFVYMTVPSTPAAPAAVAAPTTDQTS